MKKKMILIFMFLFMCIWLGVVPIYAEEHVEGDTTEEVFQEVEYSYDIQKTGEKGTITLISETECELSNESGVFLRTTYSIEGDLLIIDKSNEQIHFRINDTFELEFIGFFELSSNFKEVVYTLNDGEDIVTITLISSTECTIVIYHEDATATVNGTYVIEGDVLTLYIAGELFSNFTILEDGTLEFIEEEIIVPVPPIDEEFTPSDIGKYFEENIAPLLIEVGVTLLGLIISAIIILIKNKKFSGDLTSTVVNNVISNKNCVEGAIKNNSVAITNALEDNSKNINKFIAGNTQAYNDMVVAIEELRTSIKNENATLKAEVTRLKAEKDKLYEDNQKIVEISDDLQRLKRAFSVIACNDPKLVANGQAKFVAKELNTDGESKRI